MRKNKKQPAPFLPMSRGDMDALGWDQLDVLLVTGDAYVDHPAFGAAVVGRVLEAEGFRVGIVAQPNWRRPEDFDVMGAPRLFVGVTAGAMDSMVANYTANKKPRREDAFTPSGRAGKRPNRATVVYTNVVRSLFKDTPVVIGGIEASLRRFAHFDYWKNRVRRSILLDSKADILAAGMAERAVVEIARRLKAGRHLHRVPGTVEALPAKGFSEEILANAQILPPFEEVESSKKAFLQSAKQLENAVCGMRNAERGGMGNGECGVRNEKKKAIDPKGSAGGGESRVILQKHGDRYVVEWPAGPMASEELDAVYALPYQRKSHPAYKSKIPALEPVQFSVVSHRGCFGGCTFCALALHQGSQIISRSPESILAEIKNLTGHPEFHGTITDVGGPTANMYAMAGRDAGLCARCRRPSCLHPALCANLDNSHKPYLDLLQRALKIPGVKHLFIASGLRYDLLEAPEAEAKPAKPARFDKKRGRRKPQKSPAAQAAKDNDEFFDIMVRHLVGGHLSVAPEHVATGVLRRMRKPPIQSYIDFAKRFEAHCAQIEKKQYLTPYFIASFPGSTDADMKSLMRYLKLSGRKLQQVQDFLPSPMTLASAMYHAELDAFTLKPLHVAKTDSQRKSQRELLLYHQEQEKKTTPKQRLAAGKRKGKPARKKTARPKPKPKSARPEPKTHAPRQKRTKGGTGKATSKK